MWLLIFLFGASTLTVAWCLFGYFCWLGLKGLLAPASPEVPAPSSEVPGPLPTMTVIVPCRNEASEIQAKVEDLRSLVYPSELVEFVFADGRSTDGTPDLLEAILPPNGNMRLLRCREAGKIAQINEALECTSGDIVVNTDSDARLDPGTLLAIGAQFAASPDLGVVGAFIRPADGLQIETYYWDAQNRGRLLESDAISASIVVAPCYAFRRGLMDRFPPDVVADDVYVAMLAHVRGLRVLYSRIARGIETRVPRSLRAFMQHKFRKSNAFLREMMRFQYRLADMDLSRKVVVTTRLHQMLSLPWMSLLWLAAAGSLLTLSRIDIVGMATVFLLSLLLTTSMIFRCIPVPEKGPSFAPHVVILGYLSTMLILLSTGLTFPFFRQDSRYARLPQGSPS